MLRIIKHHGVLTILLGASTMALMAYYLEAPYEANILISLLLLVGSVSVACTNRNLGLMLTAILCVKFLYVLDLIFAIADGRPLRWVAASSADRVLVRSQVLLFICIWIASFSAVFALFVNRGRSSASPRIAAPLPLIRTGMGLVLLSQFAFAVIAWKAGGISNMLAAMSSRYELYFGIGFLRVVVALGAVGGALFLLGRNAPLGWFVSLVIFVELATLGGRSFALLSTFVPVMLVWVSQRIDFPLRRVALLGVFAIFFVGALGAYRSSQQMGQYGRVTNPVMRIAMDTGGADNFPGLLVLLQREQISFAGWKIVAAGLVAPVPRALWANKPVADEAAAVGVILAGADDVNSGLPIGPHGLAFYSAGGIAVPLFGMLAGLFAAWVVALARTSTAWMAVGPFVLLITPDVFSPAVLARILLLVVVAWAINIATRVRLR